MLVFYIIITIILIVLNLAFLISLSKIELDIKNLQMNNIDKKRNNEKIQIKISLKIGEIRWIHIKIDKRKLSTIYAKMKKKQYKKNITNKDIQKQAIQDMKTFIKSKNIKQSIKNIKIKIEKLDTKISIGTKNYITTSYLVAILSIIISNTLPHFIDKKTNLSQEIFYKIQPIYNPINIYDIQGNIRISTKISIIIKNIYQIKVNKKKINVQTV